MWLLDVFFYVVSCLCALFAWDGWFALDIPPTVFVVLVVERWI